MNLCVQQILTSAEYSNFMTKVDALCGSYLLKFTHLKKRDMEMTYEELDLDKIRQDMKAVLDHVDFKEFHTDVGIMIEQFRSNVQNNDNDNDNDNNNDNDNDNNNIAPSDDSEGKALVHFGEPTRNKFCFVMLKRNADGRGYCLKMFSLITVADVTGVYLMAAAAAVGGFMFPDQVALICGGLGIGVVRELYSNWNVIEAIKVDLKKHLKDSRIDQSGSGAAMSSSYLVSVST